MKRVWLSQASEAEILRPATADKGDAQNDKSRFGRKRDRLGKYFLS